MAVVAAVPAAAADCRPHHRSQSLSPCRFLSEAGLLELPESLAQLTTMRKLWLNQNALRSLPDILSRLCRLQALLASGNVFRELPPASVPACSLHAVSTPIVFEDLWT